MLQLKQRNVKRQINNFKKIMRSKVDHSSLHFVSFKTELATEEGFLFFRFPLHRLQYTPFLTGTPRLSSCDARGCFSLSVVSR